MFAGILVLPLPPQASMTCTGRTWPSPLCKIRMLNWEYFVVSMNIYYKGRLHASNKWNHLWRNFCLSAWRVPRREYSEQSCGKQLITLFTASTVPWWCCCKAMRNAIVHCKLTKSAGYPTKWTPRDCSDIQWTLELRPAWHTNNLGYDQNFSFDLRPKSWVTTRMPVKAKTRGCKQRPEMRS